MKTMSFIQLGLVSTLLVYTIGSVSINGLNDRLQEDYNPVSIAQELPQIDAEIEKVKEKIAIGIDDAKYLKDVKSSDVNKDIKEFNSILADLEEVNKTYSIWKIKNKNVLEGSQEYEDWGLLDKVKWVTKVLNLKDTMQELELIDKKFKKVEPKIELLAKESKDITNDFIAKYSDTDKLLNTLSKSYKDLKIVNEKVASTEKVVNYLHNNTALISTGKTSEFNTGNYVGKMSVMNDKVTYALNIQEQTSKKVEEIKDNKRFTQNDEREWVLKMKEINKDLVVKEKVDELKKDLKEIEQEINPVLASLKKVEKGFSLNNINKVYGDKLKSKIQVAETNKDKNQSKLKL